MITGPRSMGYSLMAKKRGLAEKREAEMPPTERKVVGSTLTRTALSLLSHELTQCAWSQTSSGTLKWESRSLILSWDWMLVSAGNPLVSITMSLRTVRYWEIAGLRAPSIREGFGGGGAK